MRSANGTWVDKKLVGQGKRIVLSDGDEITIQKPNRKAGTAGFLFCCPFDLSVLPLIDARCVTAVRDLQARLHLPHSGVGAAIVAL